MKFTELKDDIKNGRREIYLFEGDDAYFRTSAENMVKNAFLEMPELNYISFDGESKKGSAMEDIVSAISVFPFMAPCRLIKVSEFYPTEDDYEKYLKTTFESFPDTATLIIVNSQSKKGCDLKRKKAVSYFDCNKADRETVARWAYLTMKKAGVSSSVEACEAIADYCVMDMARVSKEVEKLIEWGKDGLVTKADVDELVYKDADYRVYQMTGAVARGDYSTFTEICKDLLSKGYDSNAVIASLLNYFKNLLTVLVSDKPQEELCAMLKMKDFALNKTRQQAKAMGKDRLIRLIDGLYNAASSTKSGLITPAGSLESVYAQVFFG
ncbi:MAG: DNA polymerase III subunit delta [Candidatus Coproplasma sp.]